MPSVGSAHPARHRSNVDLPDPFSPIRKASSPAFKENETSRNTSNPPYENARSLTSNANGAETFAVEGTECRSFEGKGAPRSTKRLFIELYRRCGTSLLRTGNESATHRPRAALRTRAISVKQAKCAFARRWEVLPRADLRRIARRSKQYRLGKEGSLLSDAGPIADAAETFYSKGFALFPAFGCSSVPRMTQRAGIARIAMHGEDEA